jgi:hypothetical protein
MSLNNLFKQLAQFSDQLQTLFARRELKPAYIPVRNRNRVYRRRFR